MFIFWAAQTICFSIDQQMGSTTAGHAVVVFICKCPILEHNLLLTLVTQVLFYGFCEYASSFQLLAG